MINHKSFIYSHLESCRNSDYPSFPRMEKMDVLNDGEGKQCEKISNKSKRLDSLFTFSHLSFFQLWRSPRKISIFYPFFIPYLSAFERHISRNNIKFQHLVRKYNSFSSQSDSEEKITMKISESKKLRTLNTLVKEGRLLRLRGKKKTFFQCSFTSD